MGDSLKDQLLGLGFKPVPKAEPKPAAARSAHNGHATRNRKPSSPQAKTPETQQEIDLGKAFALRKQQEQRERERLEREKQAEALHKKQAKDSVAKLLEGRILNAADAEIARHFSYGGKIKRIYVNAEQLPLLNSGSLGVVQFNGRYCLVAKDIALAVRALLPSLLALYCDGNEQVLPADYDDPRFQVPDDLVW